MRMRGLEPPRGFEGCGVVWRDVVFAGIPWLVVTRFRPYRAGFAD
jgi:hypothetical protein